MPASESGHWILLATAIFTFLTAAGAFLSAWLMSRTSLAGIVISLDKEYGSPEMRAAIADLYRFIDKHGHNTWLDRYVERWNDPAKDTAQEVSTIDPGRRIVEQWYYQLDHMLVVRCINKRFVRHFLTPTQIQVLEEFVYPVYRRLPRPGHAFEHVFRALGRKPPLI